MQRAQAHVRLCIRKTKHFFTYEFTFHAYDKLFFITAIIHPHFTLSDILVVPIVMYKGLITFSRETYTPVQLLES